VVGIVVVSHSAGLAEGVVRLAREMAGPDVPLEAAGGLDEPERPLGTDAVLVMGAIERAAEGGEALVLMDLGSAVLSAETALDLLPDELRPRVRLVPAPLVEGAVAAAVAARLGGSLDEVAAEAARGLAGKQAQLAGADRQPSSDEAALPAAASSSRGEDEGDWRSARAVVAAAHGLHARPAARLVRTAGGFASEVEVRNVTSSRGPASARSLSALAILGARQGDELLLRARGADAEDALAAVVAIVEDPEGGPAPVPARAAPPAEAEGPAPEPGERLAGAAASPGLAIGPARPLRRPEIAIDPEPGGSPGAEGEALTAALAAAAAELSAARDALVARGAEAEAEIVDAQLLVLEDEELLAPAREAVASGRSAAWAWREAVEAAARGYDALEDQYLRARAVDVREAGGRALAHLAGAAPRGRGAPGILVADELGAAETAELDPASVLGIATARGGPTSHSAILARALGVPAVAGLGPRVLAVADGTPLLLDGGAGAVTVAPDEATTHEAERRRDEGLALARAARERAGEPAVTRDGRRIEVVANIGGPDDVAAALAAGAEGVGLLRTEVLFMGRDRPPDEEEQREAYARVAEALDGRRLILRTLDAGADKPLPYLGQAPEENPFLGVRGLRLSLDRPELLLTQLRAALRVAAERRLAVMFPMVSTPRELRAARALMDEARDGLAREGLPVPERLETGIMVEVPAAALMADRLAPEVDFLSVGTNDLTQYAMAAERGNGRLAALLDGLEPAVLRLIAATCDAAEAHGRWVGVCGELAGDPVAVPVLVGLGVSELSASAPALPLVKETVRGLDLGEARALARAALEREDAAAVRALITG
jgi:multiphosphoryl transfer protein